MLENWALLHLEFVLIQILNAEGHSSLCQSRELLLHLIYYLSVYLIYHDGDLLVFLLYEPGWP